MWAKIRAVWMRELLDTVRDKRTLYMMVLLPIVLMPLMALLGPVMMVRQQEAMQEVVPVASLIGGEHVSGLIERARTAGTLVIEGAPAESAGPGLEKRLEDGEVDLIVYFGDDAAERLAAEQTVSIELVYAAGNSRSVMALQRFEALLDGYGAEIATVRLQQRDLTPELTRPFEIGARRNITPERQFTAQMLAMMIPLFISMWAVAGGMYTAIDAAAGEKERNSLESLIMAPVSAGVFVIGKFLAVATVAFVAIMLLIGSMVASVLYALPRLLGAEEMMEFSFTPGGVLLLLAVMALFVALMSAVQLGLSVFSKSFREAQAYMTGLMFLVMLPGMYLMFVEEVGAALWMYVVPVLNVLLITRELLEGTPSGAALLVAVLSLALTAAVALWLTWRAFRHERVVFRT